MAPHADAATAGWVAVVPNVLRSQAIQRVQQNG